MKKALGLLALAGVAFLVFHHVRTSGPEARYREFAEAILNRHYDAAAAMAEGLSAKELEKRGSQEQIGPGPEMFQTLFPSRYAIESQESAADGAVTLHATQTVLFNPAGVESAARPAMYATLRQVITLRKGSGGWMVTGFSNRFEKMDSVGGR